MKKSILLIAALVTFAATLYANPVGTDMARRVATQFWNGHRPADVKTAGTVTKLTFSDLDQLHVFDINGTGFVIIAGDDCVMPVLAYSFHNTFPAELNPEVGYWLQGYNDQIGATAKTGLPTHSQWADLTTEGKDYSTPKDLSNIPAMLTTKWDQGDPYNLLCPYDSSRHARTVVGCVATAMAQIMKYWNYPSCGEGSHSYSPENWRSDYDFGTLSADFANTTYLWQFMPNTLSAYSPAHQKNAVATLSYHCGVAVEMMYGPSSGAYSSCGYWTPACATNAFWQYFKYDSALYHADRYAYADSEWVALIDHELAEGHPIYYSGHDTTGGHAFVLDGADLEGRYHFNWGWAGYGDGFYTIDDLSPRSGGAGGNATYTFNLDQGAIFGIKPARVETFDTVDYYDSICDNYQYIDFREYHLRVAEMDTLLRHLDTIFNYHLTLINKKRILLDPNCAGHDTKVEIYCPATGYTFPENTFTNEGHIFVGWCHSATGDDSIYQPGQHIDIRTNRTFYALWLGNAGIESRENEDLRLWPNPTTGELFIAMPAANGSIIITDVMGRVVLRNDNPDITGGSAKISLQGLSNGIYTVQVKTEKGLFNQRIIKQ